MTNLLSYYASQRVNRNNTLTASRTEVLSNTLPFENSRALSMATNKSRVESLTRARYLETFKVLQSVSNEYSEMAAFVAGEIKSRFSGRFSVLDVGAGSGLLMKTISETLDLNNITRYVGVEPDATAAASLMRFMQGYPDVKSAIEVERFDQALKNDLQQKYDVILFSHSLYGMRDPIASITEAKKLLAPNGIVIVIINTALGLNKFFTSLEPYLARESASLENFTFDSQKLASGLRQIGTTFTATPITTTFDLTSLYETTAKADQMRLDFLSFATQCEIAKAPQSIRDDAEFLLSAGCITVGKKTLLPQSMAGFLIS